MVATSVHWTVIKTNSAWPGGTLRTHYRRFQDELKASPKALWPSVVPEALMPVVQTLWQTAMEAAEAQYQALKADADSRVKAAEQNAQEAQQTLSAAQQRGQRLAHQLAAARDQIQSLEKALAVAQDRLATRNR